VPTASVTVSEREFQSADAARQRQIRQLSDRLAVEPYIGDRIPKRLVPKPVRSFQNLFRLELSGGWMALYTVAGAPSEHLEVRILWIGNHKRYERLFGH
jgi:hypothetical protein